MIARAITAQVLGMLVFPSGPFIRPHPLVWRVAFGVGVVYQLYLVIMLFQTRGERLLLFLLVGSYRRARAAENARFSLTFFYPAFLCQG